MDELEFQTLLVPLDEQYQQKITELSLQGWSVIEGTAPFAVFNLCRPCTVQEPDTPVLKGRVEIDESGVTVIKGN